MAQTSGSLAPTPFRIAEEAVRGASLRSELQVEEISAPTGLAPYAIALAGDVRPVTHGVDSLLGTGRFVLLYDPDEPAAWGGPFRVVCFAQAPLESDIGLDPFVADVAWSWLVDGLAARGADYHSASGTATKVLATGFGELAGETDSATLELRASWSPGGGDLGQHAAGWGDLLCLLAGLPPSDGAVGLLPGVRAVRD